MHAHWCYSIFWRHYFSLFHINEFFVKKNDYRTVLYSLFLVFVPIVFEYIFIISLCCFVELFLMFPTLSCYQTSFFPFDITIVLKATFCKNQAMGESRRENTQFFTWKLTQNVIWNVETVLTVNNLRYKLY